MKVKSESEVAQLYLTLSDPMDYSPPGSSVHGIFQARVLEWVAIAFSEQVLVTSNQIPYDYTMEVRKRFKGLYLIDRAPDELWNEVRDIVQETGIKTIPMENKCKKAKWLSEGALQIAVKRREVKSKGEKDRFTHLNAEFQSIARRDKKASHSDQCMK